MIDMIGNLYYEKNNLTIMNRTKINIRFRNFNKIFIISLYGMSILVKRTINKRTRETIYMTR